MHSSRSRRPVLAVLLLIAAVGVLSGCVPAQKTRYQRHLSTLVSPTPATEVSLAASAAE